jgi:hypothetical protein
MSFASHNAEIVLRVLVAVLHLDLVAGQLSLMGSREIAFIVMTRIPAIWR